MIVSKDHPLVRVGERVFVASEGRTVVPRIAGVVEQVNVTADVGRLSRADVVIRVSEAAAKGAKDVSNATSAVRTWTDGGVVPPLVADFGARVNTLPLMRDGQVLTHHHLNRLIDTANKLAARVGI